MDLKTIALSKDGFVGQVMLNRPDRANAWTGRMHTELRWAFDQLENDQDIRVIVLTGAGKQFCVGGDARALEGHSKRGGYDPGTPDEMANPGYGVAEEFDQNFAWMFGLTKPVIAGLNGAAAGVGLAMACFADIRIARADAKFTSAHGRLNLPAEYGLSWLLPRIVGLGRANDLLLRSRIFTGDDGFQMGLFNEVATTPGDVRDAAMSYAQSLATDIAPGSLRATKRQIALDLHRDVGMSVAESEDRLNAMMKEADYKEGVKAFAEKRKPVWKG